MARRLVEAVSVPPPVRRRRCAQLVTLLLVYWYMYEPDLRSKKDVTPETVTARSDLVTLFACYCVSNAPLSPRN